MSHITSIKQSHAYSGTMIIVHAVTNDSRTFCAVASSSRSHGRWRVRIVETFHAEERDVGRYVKCSEAAVLPSIIETIQAELAKPVATDNDDDDEVRRSTGSKLPLGL